MVLDFSIKSRTLSGSVTTALRSTKIKCPESPNAFILESGRNLIEYNDVMSAPHTLRMSGYTPLFLSESLQQGVTIINQL